MLTRDSETGMIGGVCTGLADYFDIDPTLVRALFVAGTVLSGFSVVLYLVLWLIVDDEPASVRTEGGAIVSEPTSGLAPGINGSMAASPADPEVADRRPAQDS